MKISLLSSDASHPVAPYIARWARAFISEGHDVDVVYEKSDLVGGEILFLISFGEVLDKKIRQKFASTFVIHASDLPDGRGWSPHIWEIINGRNKIIVSVIEAIENVDSGRIVAQGSFVLDGTELLDEINLKLFAVEGDLMSYVVKNYGDLVPKEQIGNCKNTYPRRTPANSELDVNKTLGEQFNLLRVVDNERYPAFFEFAGKRYVLKIRKASFE
ncbi:formyltransferase family protein [Alphaproteobacteria bacterium]|nr:formyltransferase family protein [Alphaproteobacteria bacterium]